MAWRCSGSSNAELISNLKKSNLITSLRVVEAMKSVDRANYSPRYPYEDSPQSIGFDATISAPHMHAHATENLLPFLNQGAHILDVGSGSGYLTAIFATLVGSKGKVIGIEHIPQLVELSKRNVSNDHKEFLDSGRIEFICDDGRKGYIPQAPYDAIHVGAAAPTLPQPLVDQLKSPGRMFIPIGTLTQSIWQIDKDKDGNITKKQLFGVMYVPLTDSPE